MQLSWKSSLLCVEWKNEYDLRLGLDWTGLDAGMLIKPCGAAELGPVLWRNACLIFVILSFGNVYLIVFISISALFRFRIGESVQHNVCLMLGHYA
jgi:hypothetical protein